MEVVIVGTQGVPAAYGGFESLVENIIGENCSPDIHYTVFCSSADMPDRRSGYKGCSLKYVGLHANGISSVPYDIISMMRAVRGFDVVLILGTSGCVFLPVLRLLSKSRLIVNIDGLEHRREKWGRLAKCFLRFSERCAVRNADVVIADNKGIQDYVTDTYHLKSELIAYGGDHVLRNVPEDRQKEILARYGLESGKYAITVCRIEPENNCDMILEAFAKSGKNLVFIGNWQHSPYAQHLHRKYAGFSSGGGYNLRLTDAVYDLDVLYTLRSHAACYVHGHSAGGTNPSLVEAMFFGRPVVAYDVVYNRETTHGLAYYFSTAEELSGLVSGDDLDGAALKRVAEENYTWRHIAEQYETLYRGRK